MKTCHFTTKHTKSPKIPTVAAVCDRRVDPRRRWTLDLGRWTIILLALICVHLCSSVVNAAGFRITQILTLTNNANLTNGIQFSLNGDVRTGEDIVTNAPTQFARSNRVDYAATNLLAHIVAFPFSGASVGTSTATNNIVLHGNTNVVLNGSFFGAWGNVTNITNLVYGASPVTTPLGPESNTFKNFLMSSLLTDLQTWVTNKFSNNAPAFSFFLTTITNAQSFTNKHFHGGNWGGALSNAELAYAKFTDGTMDWMSGVGPRLILVGIGFAFTNTSGDIYRVSPGDLNSVLRAGDLFAMAVEADTNTFTPALTLDAPIVLIDGWYSTNANFFGSSNWMRGTLRFDTNGQIIASSNINFIMSSDLETGWAFRSLPQGMKGANVLRILDFDPTQFAFNTNGGGMAITNGVPLTNANFHGGTNNGTIALGSYSGVDSFNGTNITASNITAGVSLNATNVNLSNVVAAALQLARVRLDGSNYLSGSIALQFGSYPSIANGAATTNEIQLDTNTVTVVSGNTADSFIIGMKDAAPRFVITINGSGNNQTYLHESGIETVAERRFKLPGGLSVTVGSFGALLWAWNPNEARWNLLAHSGPLTASATNVVIQDVGTTNATKISLLSTNHSNGALQTKTIQAGQSITLTNQGTNIVIAFTPGNFDIETNNFVMNQYYTNGATRAWVSCTVSNWADSGNAFVNLYLDQNADGGFERTGISFGAEEFSVLGIVYVGSLGAHIQPGARFMFTNRVSGGSATAIVPNSSEWVKF